jgi:hypothetical protein
MVDSRVVDKVPIYINNETKDVLEGASLMSSNMQDDPLFAVAVTKAIAA